MKIYCVAVINPTTNEIAHCVTSDAPIEDDAIPIDDTEVTYQTEKYEFDNLDNTMVRAREIIDSMEKVGNSDLSLKTGMEAKANRFTGLKKI